LVSHIEEHRLRLFENRVLRKIFGPRTDEVAGEWRRLHNEELYDRYSALIIIWVTKSRDEQDMWHIWEPGELHTVF
jgi:hypothetical protein